VAILTEKDLADAQREVKEFGKKLEIGQITDSELDSLEQRTKEMEDYSRRSAAKDRIRAAEDALRRQPAREPAQPMEEKRREENPDEVVGELTLGRAFTSSREFKHWESSARPRQPISAEIRADFGNEHVIGPVRVPLTRKQAEEKAITIGANVIQRDRTTSVVRLPAEHDEMTIRNLLNIRQAQSNVVEYMTYTGTEPAGMMVAEGGLKPEATQTADTATATVRTIAVTQKVSENMLQDVPFIENMIDNELTYFVRRQEQSQIVWGNGTGENLLGFMSAGIPLGRTVAADTLIDLIRRSITDVQIAGGTPNGIALDPLDWETIQLTKATTNEYIWVNVVTDNGNQLWGLRVIPTVAMREPGTFTTNERRFLVGDFQRGATLHVRQGIQVEAGFVNDDFQRNRRTIRVEQRVALTVERPHFFRYRVTQARVA